MSNIDKKSLIGIGPNSNKLREYKKSLISLSPIQLESAIGLVLGDASLNTDNNGKTYRLKFEWSDRQKPYVDHIFKLFDEWVLSLPHKKVRKSPKGNEVITWGFQTISHSAFNKLAELFIVNNKKTVPQFLIKNHLSERGLSYWFMDDGGKLDYNKNSKNKSIVLNTQSFTDMEVENMSKELTKKFNLNCEVRSNKGKKVIVIKSVSYPLFKSLIDPYILSDMRYKLP
jgi:LAGLIDADG DNA endonuclease family